jgi:hypothetical protein
MISVFKHKWRVALATVALGSIAMSGTAFAQSNTAAGTSITNTATVNYSVATIAQTPINAAATFVVDAIIKVSVTPVASSVTFTPGQANVGKAFTVTNSGNKASDYAFTPAPTNLGSDQFDISNINVRVDANGNGVYDPGTDNATTITGLAREASATVFVVGDIPVAAANGNTAVVRLDVTAINPLTSSEWVNDTNVDDKDTEQVVVSNTKANGQNTFVVASAALSVSKLSRVIWDPVNLFTAPKAIPLAIMEYEISVTNAVGATTATVTSISDPVPANTAFKPGDYTGSRDVGVKIGAAPEFFCIAEVGADSNGDGCSLNGGAVTVGAPAISTIAANTTIVVRFRVTIQ